MFYKKYIDITNDKQMFNFLKEHFTYYTLNSWNGLRSIAHNVKLYRLNLRGSWTTALHFLETGDYETVNWMILDWERLDEHVGYHVYFNGRSGGYIVLASIYGNTNILPDCITECGTYEEYKAYCRENFGSVKANRWELVRFTNLVRDFDKLCDEIRCYVDSLSALCVEKVTLARAVEEFNETYEDDLELLKIPKLVYDSMIDETVNISNISKLRVLLEAFVSIAKKTGLKAEFLPQSQFKLVQQ